MALTTTPEGIQYGWQTRDAGWGAGMEENLRRLADYARDGWARDYTLSAGLNYAFRGGVALTSAGLLVRVAGGIVVLTDNAVNYVERTYLGVVSVNTVGWTSGRIPMAKVTTLAGVVTAHDDQREEIAVPALEQGNLRRHGAAVDGATNDTPRVADALTAQAGKEVVVPIGTVRVTGQSDVAASTQVRGAGAGSRIETVTAAHHLIRVAAAGAVLRALRFAGVAGGTVINNSAIVFDGIDGATAEYIEAGGMSGIALYASGANSHLWLFRNYIHGLTPTAADIALIGGASRSTAAFNRLMGGANTELAILLQNGSTKHLIIGNEVGAHDSYGIIDYDVAPKATYNIIVLNRIDDIGAGAFGGGAKGAGIYLSATGGQIVAHNQLSNTNIATANATLAPGAIGVNGAFSPILISGNYSAAAQWYAFYVTVVQAGAIVELANNHAFEPVKGAYYIVDSSHVSISGGTITQLTATPLTVRAIGINLAAAVSFRNVTVRNVHIRGSFRAIEIAKTDQFGISGNTISEVNGIGIRVDTCVGGSITDNQVDSSASAVNPAIDLVNATYVTLKGNTLKSAYATCIRTAGVCTGSVCDESNVLVGMNMNNIDNAAVGMRFTTYGAAAPTVLNHAVGDRVINNAPAVGNPKSWVCTVAGLPGTWVSEGNL